MLYTVSLKNCSLGQGHDLVRFLREHPEVPGNMGEQEYHAYLNGDYVQAILRGYAYERYREGVIIVLAAVTLVLLTVMFSVWITGR